MKTAHVIDLKKARPTETKDGELTRYGMVVAHKYAKFWIERASRDLELERKHPELAGLFYDIRIDAELAREHAIPMGT
jgi:hypothetical protein